MAQEIINTEGRHFGAGCGVSGAIPPPNVCVD
jgi:hypothetical protein